MIGPFRGEYRWLSNFWFLQVPVVLADNDKMHLAFPTVEHAYVAAKTTDMDTRLRIQKIQKPGDVKRMGRSLVLRPDWDGIKLAVMRDLVDQKFKGNEELATRLLSTGNEEIVEVNNWHDNFWGVCDCDRCRRNSSRVQKNWLGILIMQTRDDLRGL